MRDLHGLTKLDWKDMDILLGLGKRLAIEVKTWYKESQNHGVRNSLDNLAEVALGNGGLEDFNIGS